MVGSKKMLVYDDVSPEAKLRLYDKAGDFASFQMIARAGDILITKINFREPLAAQVAHFGQCIQDGSEPRTGATSGRRVVAVLEAAQRSLRNRGALEAVHLERRPTEVAA